MSEPRSTPAALEDVPGWAGAYVSQCIGCTGTDNHPKLQTGSFDAPPILWHHDCYVIAKAPGWERISEFIIGAGGATGHALRLHLHPDPTQSDPTPALEA